MYRVKKRREELGMTQQDLAKKAQVSRQTIVSIESNENFQTSTATLVKIARALNCKVSSIFLA
ncbi:helix-turn-helix transcriptional regulator [uncultured Megasphaera sp.]|uniref:helix-turn-helix transcriptional regulator n=1 Tax=uncultured Megasphaera sp. TaxID=165188 RepID=UPI00206FEB1C|nr:helix-turn-helix domain-containing protein [uncultured Megasphaera sp.]DAK43011.1 MAG TPA: putative transcriptional regulator [Caudoviricetes sp.]